MIPASTHLTFPLVELILVLLSVRCPQAALSRDFVSRASLLMLRLSEPCNTLADQAVLARISEAVSYLCMWLPQCPWFHVTDVPSRDLTCAQLSEPRVWPDIGAKWHSAARALMRATRAWA